MLTCPWWKIPMLERVRKLIAKVPRKTVAVVIVGEQMDGRATLRQHLMKFDSDQVVCVIRLKVRLLFRELSLRMKKAFARTHEFGTPWKKITVYYYTSASEGSVKNHSCYRLGIYAFRCICQRNRGDGEAAGDWNGKTGENVKNTRNRIMKRIFDFGNAPWNPIGDPILCSDRLFEP